MNQTTDNRLWTGSFIKICLVNFFIFVNFHALLPTFPFFVTYLGGDAVAIGLATALFSIASIVSRPFVGWLVDSKGRCTMLVIGLIGMTLLPMGYFVSSGIAWAVLLRTVHGAFHAASSNASSTWVTDIVPHTRMGEGLGMYGLSMALSTAVAPALGLGVMNAWGFRPLFAVTTLAGLIALLIGISIRQRNYTLSAAPLRLNQLFERMSLPAAVTQFFFMMAYGVVEVYVAIYAAGHGLPGGGIYFICIALATVATRLLLGRAIDRHGEGVLVYTGNGAIIAGILLLVFAHNAPCYLLSALLLGYSFGAVQPSLQTMAMHAVAPERRGAANSTFFVAFDLGIALGGFLAGVLVKQWGYDVMFLLIACSSVLSIAYYHLFGRNHASSFNPRRRQAQASVAASAAVASTDRRLPLVITISREYGSGGRHIGELLARKLGIGLYDKSLIELTARQSGLNSELVKEQEQVVEGRLPYDNPLQTAMFKAQEAVIRDIARQGSCVIVGRLANFILRGDECRCYNIFIYANRAYRLKHIVAEYGVAEEEAAARMQRTDRERSEHCLHYTGYEWGAYSNYHLMIDSAALGDEETAELICRSVKPMLS